MKKIGLNCFVKSRATHLNHGSGSHLNEFGKFRRYILTKSFTRNGRHFSYNASDVLIV